MSVTKKISYKEHDENNLRQATYLRASCAEITRAKIQRINDQLEIALWNMEKRVKDLDQLNQRK